MALFQRNFRIGQIARSAVLSSFLVGSMVVAGSAWGVDTPPQQQANKPASKLQVLTDHASELALHAMGMLGIHYKYGGSTPEEGLDCSGLVNLIFKEAWGKELPRTAKQLSREGERVEKTDLQPGDLVFYNTLRRSFSHVGIYLGDRKFIHAPSSGGQVRIESMDVDYWKKRFNGARRISEPEM
ncbi:MAG: C40 family peptidase [Oxalicibacterium faecigallinarum]|uniref:C40 family peptidase n=1 Tax=Oxalicibacterium faecigallinarum TaxID=573741 RepID=UPI0028080313|nr:C40 family peptidase [Oxalicibacterium faecigallinarum]MDQ7969834.1 C40 family peptidase [Oxalicibacterium faecigallinarum]